MTSALMDDMMGGEKNDMSRVDHVEGGAISELREIKKNQNGGTEDTVESLQSYQDKRMSDTRFQKQNKNENAKNEVEMESGSKTAKNSNQKMEIINEGGEADKSKNANTVRWDDRFEPFFIHASLLQMNRIGHIPINGLLITAMQEWWRKETHTFHMPHGEMTITLEDGLCIMGMRVDGQPLCKNNSVIDWADKAEELLGKRPPEEMFRGTEKKRSKFLVRKKWFKANFNDLGECEPDEWIEQYCRAYMLAFFTDVLFTDPNGDCYSLIPLLLLENMQELDKWSFGSGVLAYLYRELCKSVDVGRKNMGGCVLLLQLWVWQHFSTGRPTVSLAVDRLTTNANFPDRNDTVGMLWANVTQKDFKKPETNLWANRDMLDSQPPTDVFWTPYEIYRERLPPICNHERGMSRLRQPLIYFWIVERYRPSNAEFV
ncbi:hypothetical protein LUZ60_003553 [Juncus effusus]|nr:hypothetical protein LUZ60_003553 [Juncus effusus]